LLRPPAGRQSFDITNCTFLSTPDANSLEQFLAIRQHSTQTAEQYLLLVSYFKPCCCYWCSAVCCSLVSIWCWGSHHGLLLVQLLILVRVVLQVLLLLCTGRAVWRPAMAVLACQIYCPLESSSKQPLFQHTGLAQCTVRG